VGEYTVAVEHDPRPEDQRVIFEGLVAHNEAHAGGRGHAPVFLSLRDMQGAVVGGLIGSMVWGWLHVDILWVSEAVRGWGYGSKLLREAESHALAAGCQHAFLETLDFQALPFYQRHDYEVFGTLEGFPPGHRQYYLRKQLGDS
jgi:GNAT superfamily N-acetyltransferase